MVIIQEAEKLVNAKIHPQTIIAGWRLATDSARAALTSVARDNSGDPDKFNEVRKTSFSGFWCGYLADWCALIGVDLVCSNWSCIYFSLQDLLNIARTTLSSKILTQHKDFFARLAVAAVTRLKGSGNLEAIQIIKKLGSSLADSYLEEGDIYTLNHSLVHTHMRTYQHTHNDTCTLVHTHTLKGFYWRRRWE